jgi:hypothetical protein
MQDNDPVNKPTHYNQGGIEAIDAIEASMSPLEFQGYLKGNAMKYLWRYRYKGHAAQDLGKAKFYLSRLMETVEDFGIEEAVSEVIEGPVPTLLQEIEELRTELAKAKSEIAALRSRDNGLLPLPSIPSPFPYMPTPPPDWNNPINAPGKIDPSKYWIVKD